MLYERAKQLQGKGLSAAEIREGLLAEGAREEDVRVILGSLGLGPQPESDPTPRPLKLAQRVMKSPSMRLAVFAIAMAALGALFYVVRAIGTVVSALAESFSRGQ